MLFFAFQLFRHSCSLRELSQVRGTSFSGGEGITLLPAISCTFCNPHGSCIKQSGLEPPPATTSHQPAHRPVTQDAGSAPHDDKRPTRFVGRSLKYSLFLASEAIDKQRKLEWYRRPHRRRRTAAVRFGLRLAKDVRVITNSPPTSLIERVQKIDCATPDPSETAVHFHETVASMGKNGPRGSRERAPVYVKCKLKDNDEVAHQQLPSTINFDSATAQQVIVVS